VGAIPGDAVMHERPVGRGYVRLAETADFPWPHPASQDATPTRLGHEFHHSSLENLDASVRTAYRVLRGHGIGDGRDGVCVHNLLASYAHLRHTGGNDWPRRFMAFVREVGRARGIAAAPPRRAPRIAQAQAQR
jgi:cobyrinic acid a,c-diamide synthase